jgi:hypothetical protein
LKNCFGDEDIIESLKKVIQGFIKPLVSVPLDGRPKVTPQDWRVTDALDQFRCSHGIKPVEFGECMKKYIPHYNLVRNVDFKTLDDKKLFELQVKLVAAEYKNLGTAPQVSADSKQFDLLVSYIVNDDMINFEKLFFGNFSLFSVNSTTNKAIWELIWDHKSKMVATCVLLNL